MDFGIHMLDQLCWYFGKIETVEAHARKLYSKEVEDELQAYIFYDQGVRVRFETSWSKEEYRKTYARLEIKGTKGKMIVTDQTLAVFDNEGRQIVDLVYPALYGGSYLDVGGILFSQQMEAFLDVLENRQATNLESAVYVQKAIKEIYNSVKLKRMVSVN